VKQLYWGGPAEDCEDLLVQPAGRIDRELIVSEKANIDRIVATLALKETTQSILVRQLCALPAHNRTRKAVFEFDRLIRSIYTLHYLLDPRCKGTCIAPRTASSHTTSCGPPSRRSAGGSS
jgi:TnpA family transposase